MFEGSTYRSDLTLLSTSLSFCPGVFRAVFLLSHNCQNWYMNRQQCHRCFLTNTSKLSWLLSLKVKWHQETEQSSPCSPVNSLSELQPLVLNFALVLWLQKHLDAIKSKCKKKHDGSHGCSFVLFFYFFKSSYILLFWETQKSSWRMFGKCRSREARSRFWHTWVQSFIEK